MPIFPTLSPCLIPLEQGSLFCSPMYLKKLEQGLINSKNSVNYFSINKGNFWIFSIHIGAEGGLKDHFLLICSIRLLFPLQPPRILRQNPPGILETIQRLNSFPVGASHSFYQACIFFLPNIPPPLSGGRTSFVSYPIFFSTCALSSNPLNFIPNM